MVHFQRLVSDFRTRRTLTPRPGLKETQTKETQTSRSGGNWDKKARVVGIYRSRETDIGAVAVKRTICPPGASANILALILFEKNLLRSGAPADDRTDVALANLCFVIHFERIYNVVIILLQAEESRAFCFCSTQLLSGYSFRHPMI